LMWEKPYPLAYCLQVSRGNVSITNSQLAV
jgi:hypothetical protein